VRKPAIYADLCEIEPLIEPGDEIYGWRVTFREDDSSIGGVPFASKRDCDRMIAELAKRGVVDLETYEAARPGIYNKCIAAALPW